MKFYFTLFLHSFLALNFVLACSFDVESFCGTSMKDLNDLTVAGYITSVDVDGINFEILQILHGDETKTNIRIWDGTDFNCNGPFSMAASDFGDINDTLILILPQIDSLENRWDVLGDYRRPNNYWESPLLKVKENVVTGYISGFPLASSISSYDYDAFITDWSINGNCSGLSSIGEPENRVDLIVSPNPASNFVRLVSNENLNSLNVKIFNQVGKEVMSEQNFNGNSDISVADLPQGVYYLLVEEEYFKPSFVRFVKI